MSLHGQLARIGVIVCLTGTPGILFAQSATADDTAASHIRAVEHLLEVENMRQVMETQGTNMLQQEIKAAPQLAPYADILKQFAEKYGGYDAMKPDIVKVFAAKFTESELNQLSDFYKTDLGKIVMQRMPEVMTELQGTVMERTRAATPELMAAIQDRMTKAGTTPTP